MQNPKPDAQLITGRELKYRLAATCSAAESSVTVLSAYVKLSGLKWLAQTIPEAITVHVIARWQVQDLIHGASDLAAYEFCRDRNWRFGIDPNLHSKAYIIDHRIVFLGSSNLTTSGLSLLDEGNLEINTAIVPTTIDLDKLKRLEKNCCWLDDALYSAISEEVGPHLNNSTPINFSPFLMSNLSQSVEFLWVSELPQSTPDQLFGMPNGDNAHDIQLFGLGAKTLSRSEIIARFKSSRVRQWFFHAMQSDPTTFMSFGWLTGTLHSALLDEPPPNRSDVKHYVSCLIEWLRYCETERIQFIQHRRTVSMVLKGS
jgi:hypothetical protein